LIELVEDEHGGRRCRSWPAPAWSASGRPGRPCQRGRSPPAGVGQAQGRVRQGVQPLGLDGIAAGLAATEAAGVDPGQGVLDLVDQVLGVADQRQVALALEGEAAGVGELLVEADLAGGVGQAGLGRLLQVGALAVQLGQLGLQPPAVGLQVPLGDRASGARGVAGPARPRVR
jgi:hypothetical protein